MKQRIIALVAAIVCVAVLVISVGYFHGDVEKTSDGAAETVTYSTDKPDETVPKTDYVWKGSVSDPKKIVIPSIGVDAYLQNVGVDQNQEVAVPNNIHLGGWFVESVRPGDKGLSIIDGHLNGHTTDGVFADLAGVELGAELTVEFGDNSKRMFVVKDVQFVDTDKAASVLFSQDPSIFRQLTLVTCGGVYDAAARLYDKRVIVVAERI